MRVLSSGVDTLELTARGKVREAVWADLLDVQRRAAENEQPESVELAGQAFLVQPHGWRNYGLWLRSDSFELMLGCNEHFPAARVEVSSSCLHALGPQLASELVGSTLGCGVLSGEVEPKVSRIDLYCDVQGWPLRLEDLGRFVTRARSRRGHLDEDQVEEQIQPARVYNSAIGLTGLDFGRRGGGVYVRIYDKTTEIGRRGSAWLPDLWGSERLPGAVWRVEAELRRVVLVDHGLRTAHEVLAGQQDLWRYVTGSWLTYRTRMADGRTRRWPVDPVWETVQAVELSPAQTGGGARPHCRSDGAAVGDGCYRLPFVAGGDASRMERAAGHARGRGADPAPLPRDDWADVVGGGVAEAGEPPAHALVAEWGVKTGFDFAAACGALVVLTPIGCYVSYRIGTMVGRASR